MDTSGKHKRPVIRSHRQRGLSDWKKQHPFRRTLHPDSPQEAANCFQRPQLWVGAALRWSACLRVQALGSIPSTKERKKGSKAGHRCWGAETSTPGTARSGCGAAQPSSPAGQRGTPSSISQGTHVLHAHPLQLLQRQAPIPVCAAGRASTPLGENHLVKCPALPPAPMVSLSSLIT